MEYKNAWLIIAKANLHVGNENISNYGLIDKAINVILLPIYHVLTPVR